MRAAGPVLSELTGEGAVGHRNPTQYKLDLLRFADRYSTVFWMDSDVIIYRDMTPFLNAFLQSQALFYLVPDHVLLDPQFMERWQQQHPDAPKPFIPQACFMGFRSSALPDFIPVSAATRGPLAGCADRRSCGRASGVTGSSLRHLPAR